MPVVAWGVWARDSLGRGGWFWVLSEAVVGAVLLLAPALLHRHPVAYRLVSALMALLVMLFGVIGVFVGLTDFLLPATLVAWAFVFVGPPGTVQPART